MRKMTLRVRREVVARWIRRKAAQESISLSKLVSRMLENQMRMSGEYWRAFERWERIGSIKGIDANRRLSREQAHKRR